VNDFDVASDAAGDGRKTGSEILQDSIRKALGLGREYSNVAAAEDSWHIIAAAKERKVFRKTEPCDLFLEFLSPLSIPSKQEPYVGKLTDHGLGGCDEHRVSLHIAVHIPDENDPSFLIRVGKQPCSLARPVAEAAEVYAVMDDPDFFRSEMVLS
jgi:hypothetical protein